MRRLIDTEQEFLAHEQALGDLREAIAKKEEVVSRLSTLVLFGGNHIVR